MKKFLTASASLIIVALSSFAQAKQDKENINIDLAAKINVAENVCDINFGDRLMHHVMLAGAELHVDMETAARMADTRHRKIVSYLNRTGKLDEFCKNAKAGKL